MSFKPKAIQTEYNGCLFRSRLEARWAVFLDYIGARWWYEKEGFDFDGERYLPDFWLPIHSARFSEAGFWLEIKPVEPSDREKSLMEKLTVHTGHNSILLAGNVGLDEFTFHKWALNRKNGAVHSFQEGPYREWPFALCYLTEACPAWLGDGINAPKGSPEYRAWDRCSDYMGAFRAARKARFEFGQTPESVH